MSKPEPKKEAKRDLRLLKIVLPYVKKHRFLAIAAVLALLCGDLLQLTLPRLFQHGVDVDVKGSDLPGLARTSLFFGAALFGAFLLHVASNVGVGVLGQKLLLGLRMDVFRKVLRLGADYFDKTPTGTTLTHVTNDVESVRQFISEGLVSIAGDLLKIVLILVAMALVSPLLALTMAVSVPAFALATALFRTTIRSGFRGVRAANSAINTAMVEGLNGHREIALFDHKVEAARRFERSNKAYLSAYRQVVDAYALYLPVIEILTQVSVLGVLFAAHFGMGKTVGPGAIFAVSAYIGLFFRPLRDLAENFNTFQSALAALERIQNLLHREETTRPPEKPRLPSKISGEIVFDDVVFGYDPAQPVLRGLTFRAAPGETVAIVGPTGAGKTTITSLLTRLYDVQGGSIRVDGVDVREWPLDDLRRRVAVVPQHVFLFTGTAAENVSLFDDAIPRATVIEAARSAGLDETLQRLPNGYDTDVLEEGRSLSSGQKQLLAFARAFVRNPSVLILDEATAHVDSESEALVEASLDRLRRGRTSLLIAHRLATLRSADRILVLKHGVLAEEGNHETLLRKGGLYATLYQMQALAQAETLTAPRA